MDNSLKDFLSVLGAVAEMSLHFYRATLSAGATKEEAAVLANAYITAMIFGNRKENNNE